MRQSVLPFAARLGHHQHSPSLRLRRLRSVPGFTAISAIVLLLRGYCNTAKRKSPDLATEARRARVVTRALSPFGSRQWPSW